MDGHAGPLTTRCATWTQRALGPLLRRGGHRLISVTGPAVLTTSVLMWGLLTWAGWALMFSADPLSLVDSRQQAPATALDRVYFSGYTVFTLGNGDFAPQGPFWKLATALASLSGLFLITLAVTYLVSFLQGVTQKRSFASQVAALGDSPESFVVHTWDGRGGFPGLDLHLLSLTEQLNTLSERHEAYPMLHYYHAARKFQSVPRSLAIFDDALTLLAAGVRKECRPPAAALHCARESVRLFLDTMGGTFVRAAAEPPPAPSLEPLRAAGIPTVSDADLADRLAALDHRRRLMRGFLDGERRAWPGGGGDEGARLSGA